MATMSDLDREVLVWWARVACWRRHDTMVRALVAREVSVEAIAEARGVPVAMIDEVLKPPRDTIRRGPRR